jgi:serine/threonine protein kinase
MGLRLPSFSSLISVQSLGCTLFAMAYSHSPFENTQITEQGGSIAMAVLNAQYKHPAGSAYSQGFKELVDSMLKVDPKDRPDIHKVRCSPVSSAFPHCARIGLRNDGSGAAVPSLSLGSRAVIDILCSYSRYLSDGGLIDGVHSVKYLEWFGGVVILLLPLPSVVLPLPISWLPFISQPLLLPISFPPPTWRHVRCELC